MICSICGEEVSKRQSYALEDGTRACKKHDLTGKLPKPKLIINPKAKKTEIYKKPWEKIFTIRPCCFHCNKTGIMKQEFAYRSLIEMNKFEILNPDKILNPFNTDYIEVVKKVREHFGFLDHEEMAILDFIDISHLKDWQKKQLVDGSFQMVAEMLGDVILLCTKCQEEFDMKIKLPKMDMKDMMVLGAISKPMFQEIAKEELEKE